MTSAPVASGLFIPGDSGSTRLYHNGSFLETQDGSFLETHVEVETGPPPCNILKTKRRVMIPKRV